MKFIPFRPCHIIVPLLALAIGMQIGGQAFADSITLSETWTDKSDSSGNLTSTDTGSLNASLTIPGLSGITASDWSNLHVAIAMTPYQGSQFTEATMSDAPSTGGSISATTATFFFQGSDTNGNSVNVEKITFSRAGDTLTVADQTLNPAAVQPPTSLAAAYYLNFDGPITDSQTFDITVSDVLADGSTLQTDISKTLNITGNCTVTTDTFDNQLNDVQISGTASFTVPTVTPVSPAGSISTTNGVLNLQVKASGGSGIANVEFYWNGLDFGTGGSTAAGVWSQLFALAPGVNTFKTVATDTDGNNSPESTILVTYINNQTNATTIQCSEHYLDASQVDSGTTSIAFNQDVGTLNAAVPVPGLQSLSGNTWTNLHLMLSFGNINFSNSLAAANALTASSATFNVTDSDSNGNTIKIEQLTFTRMGDTLVIFKRTGNPAYSPDNTPIIADAYVGTAGKIRDQKPFSLTVLDGSTLASYADISQVIYLNGTNTVRQDSFGNELDDIQVTGSADFTRPVATINSPTSNQQWSNAVFTVTGKATDNVQVSNVLWSLNGADWVPAISTNNWTNWTAQVNLTPGTNTVFAYAVDSNNNVSVTNKVNFVYILSAPLTVNQTGVGAILPNYNGTLLAIGKNYSMTAKGTNGFAFTGWTGSFPTNSPTVTFTMASNLVLTANFVDTNRPTITVTSPTLNQQWSNSLLTIAGKATDNGAVTNVLFSLNNSDWLPATPGNSANWTNWTVPVYLTPGTNSLAAYSVDAYGNVSVTNKVNFVYILSALVTVNQTGVGAISPNYNGTLLAIGKNYSMTAKGTNGFKFTSWTGSFPTNSPTVTFTMASNLVLTANFVDTNRPTITVTSPTLNQQWSNSLLTIAGKATDNGAVTNVLFSLNNSDWLPVVPSNFANWTNWTAPVNLTPGTNTLAAYSVDAYGNVSVTNKVNFVYILSAVLTVNQTGVGAISPNYNGTLLAIGKNYSMTAKGTNGFKFTSWTGSFPTNSPTVTFTMASNLVLTANFVDTNRPTITVTSPTANQQWSNSLLTVAGKATDNSLVTNVLFSLNNSDWVPVVPANSANWTNWTVPVNLTPGTNTLAAYSVDAYGNVSVTNKVSFVYILSALLTVNQTGVGAISPNYNGTLLAIGKNYSMTAKGTNGFKFISWTGSFPTNGSTVIFTMASNLVLTANFVDTNRPTFSITNLVSGQRISNTLFTVSGAARDNWQVDNVFYRLNGSDWSNAVSGNNWTNWSAPLSLVPGTNTLLAYAADTSGNVSATNSLRFFQVTSAPLQIQTTGLGAVSPNYSNALLEIGRNYSITSRPAAGFIFTNWVISTNWIDGTIVSRTNVQFMMTSNLTLQANFVDVARPTLTISSPTAGQKITNVVATLAGTAKDNWKVTNVWYQLNGGDWSPAATTNQWTNWYQTVTLPLGAVTNTIKAYAVDAGGNYSATNGVSFISSNTIVPQLVFKAPRTLPSGGIAFTLQLPAGLSGTIQYSTNMIDWVNLAPFTSTTSELNFSDPAATSSERRFYRAVVP